VDRLWHNLTRAWVVIDPRVLTKLCDGVARVRAAATAKPPRDLSGEPS